MVFCGDELMTYHKVTLQNMCAKLISEAHFEKSWMIRLYKRWSYSWTPEESYYHKTLDYLDSLKSFRKSNYHASCHKNNIFKAKCFNMLPYTLPQS